MELDKANQPQERRKNEESTSEMHINDVIQECVENIFMYLNFEDLINVANVSQYFRNCSYLPFSRKYSEKTIEFPAFPYNERYSLARRCDVKITHLRFALRTLRCFGHLITKINMTFFDRGIMNSIRNNSYILCHMNEYCAESLVKLSMLTLDDSQIDLLQKPFVKVEEINIESSFNVSRLNEFFPKVRRLSFSREYDISCISKHFPQLEHLKINVNAKKVKEFDGFVDALRSNPNLRSLSIKCYSNGYNLIKSVQPYLQSIEILDLETDLCSTKMFETIHLPNVLEFKLHLKESNSWNLRNIPFTCSRLKEFTIGGKLIENELFYMFINENPTIEKLTFKYKTKFINDLIDKQELMKALPSLKKIEFLPTDICLGNIYTCMSIEFIIKLLENFESVQSCTFYCYDSDDSIKLRCDNEWKPNIIFGKSRTRIIELERII